YARLWSGPVWTPTLVGHSVRQRPHGTGSADEGRLAMFVQVIQGRVSDAAKMRSALDQWAQDLSPGAAGWLGSTAGVTHDGRFIALARFESEEAARRNSDRPEQDRWWSETSRLFAGEPSFGDSRNVVIDTTGNPDEA